MKTRSCAQGYGKLVRRSSVPVVRKAEQITGFMKHLPNLLKQESSSAATLVHILLRMYHDLRPEHQAARAQIAERLIPYVDWPCCHENDLTRLNSGLELAFSVISINLKLIVRTKISLHGRPSSPKSWTAFADSMAKM